MNMELLQIHKQIIESGLLLDSAKVGLNKITPENKYDQALKNFLTSKLTELIQDSLNLSLLLNEHELLSSDSESVCKLYEIEVKK